MPNPFPVPKRVTLDPNWRWTRKTERAAELVAADKLTDAQIAAEVGVARQSLTR